MKADETASASNYIAAAPHYLESWGDVEMKKGEFALMQPTIRPLFDTRQLQDALLKWTGNDMSYSDYIKDTWKSKILNGSSYNQALHDGVYVSGSATSMSHAGVEGHKEDEKTWVGGIIEDVSEGLGLKKDDSSDNATNTNE